MGSRLLTDPVMSFLKVKFLNFSRVFYSKENQKNLENLKKTKTRKKPYSVTFSRR
jgi:hypothetical protein